MKIEVVSQKKNPLLKRSEVMLRADHSGNPTPSRYELLDTISSTLKTQKEKIIIERIITKPGAGISEIKVHAYEKQEEIPKHKLEKMKRRTKPPKKEEQVEEQAQEQPSEEPTEESGEQPQEETAPEEQKQESTEEEKKEEGGQEQQ